MFVRLHVLAAITSTRPPVSNGSYRNSLTIWRYQQEVRPLTTVCRCLRTFYSSGCVTSRNTRYESDTRTELYFSAVPFLGQDRSRAALQFLVVFACFFNMFHFAPPPSEAEIRSHRVSLPSETSVRTSALCPGRVCFKIFLFTFLIIESIRLAPYTRNHSIVA